MLNTFAVSCLAIFASLIIAGRADDNPVSNIRKLRKDLLENYDRMARPVKNASAAVPVLIGWTAISLIEIDEKEERMVLDGLIFHEWKDEHLQWIPRAYGGIKYLHFNGSEIWHPDSIVLNGAPVTSTEPWIKNSMTVDNDGNVYWFASGAISIRCSMQYIKPTEERSCNVSISSFAHNDVEISLDLRWIVNIEDLYANDNPEWEITDITSGLKTLDFSPVNYSIATFTISAKRRYDFIRDVITGPKTIAILLVLAMFWLPPSSDKKLNLGCLVLLVLSSLLLYLSSTVSSPSLLSATVAQLQRTLFTATSAILIEVVILNLSRLSDIIRPSPALVRILSGMVGRSIGVCPPISCKKDDGMVRLSEVIEEENSRPVIGIEEEWFLTAMTLDRILFIVYAVIFIIV